MIRDVLGPLIRPHRGRIALALLFNVIVGAATAFQNVAPGYLFDWVIRPAELTRGERIGRLLALALAYLVAAIFFRSTFWHISLRLFARVRERCVRDLRAMFFRRVNRLCVRFHLRHNSGELFSYLFGSPLAQVQQYYHQFTMLVPSQGLTICITLFWLGAWDLPMTLVLGLTLLAWGFMMQHAQRSMRRLHQAFQSVEKDVIGQVSDLLRGSSAVKLHAIEEQVSQDFDEQAERISEHSYWRDVRGHQQYMKQEGIGFVGFAVLMIVGAVRYLDGELTEGALLAYLTSFLALQGPVSTLFQVAMLRGSAMAGLERICAVLKTSTSVPDPAGTPKPVPARGDIELDRVTFSYEPGRPVLRELSVRIPYGQSVALVGASGSGKSTLAQLLLRLYDPDTGAVRIGGVDLREVAGSDLRRKFGVVPQNPFIFNTTVRDNLRVVRDDATEAEIRRACEQARAWEFITKLPQGLDTPVGEGGATLSGGQRQRLAIARAILADPAYFIFDEATSALDTVSEEAIREATASLVRGRTAIFIAHRLSTVRHCDRILVLDAGRLVQDGTFAELIARPGIFQNLASTGAGLRQRTA